MSKAAKGIEVPKPQRLVHYNNNNFYTHCGILLNGILKPSISLDTKQVTCSKCLQAGMKARKVHGEHSLNNLYTTCGLVVTPTMRVQLDEITAAAWGSVITCETCKKILKLEKDKAPVGFAVSKPPRINIHYLGFHHIRTACGCFAGSSNDPTTMLESSVTCPKCLVVLKKMQAYEKNVPTEIEPSYLAMKQEFFVRFVFPRKDHVLYRDILLSYLPVAPLQFDMRFDKQIEEKPFSVVVTRTSHTLDFDAFSQAHQYLTSSKQPEFFVWVKELGN
jgi:hypothetical protein